MQLVTFSTQDDFFDESRKSGLERAKVLGLTYLTPFHSKWSRPLLVAVQALATFTSYPRYPALDCLERIFLPLCPGYKAG